MSDREALEKRADSLAGVARLSGLESPPDVDLVRWTTMDDYGPTVADCLREAGFNAVAYGGAGIDYPDGIPQAQLPAFQLADYACQAKYTIHPKYLEPFTAAQFSLIYDYWVESLLPCLEDRGYTISPAPAKETYVASAPLGQADWDPFAEAERQARPEDQQRLRTDCPAMPPSQHLWG